MDRKKIIEEFLLRAWNIKEDDVSALHSLFSPTAIVDSPLGAVFGKEGMMATYKNWITAFPDMEVFSIDVMQHADTVVAEWSCKGRHQNEFKGKMPTGKRVLYDGITIYRFEKEKVVDYHCAVNLSDVYEQLGFHAKLESASKRGALKDKYALLLQKLTKILGESLEEKEVQILSLAADGYTPVQLAAIYAQPIKEIEEILESALNKVGITHLDVLVDKAQSLSMLHVCKAFSKLVISIMTQR